VNFQDLGVPVGIAHVMPLDDQTVTHCCSHCRSPRFGSS
jgi:hypothetical protein